MDISIQDYNEKKVFLIKPNEPERLYNAQVSNKIIPNDGNFYLIPGKLKTADNSIYRAYFLISTQDNGELFDYFIFQRGEIFSSEDDLSKKLEKTGKSIFPFKYHIDYRIEDDIHTDEKY